MSEQQTDRGLFSDLAAKVQTTLAAVEGEGKQNHTGLKIGAGVLGVAAVAGAGYLAYDQWLKHHNKEHNEEAEAEFKSLANAAEQPQSRELK